MAPCHLLLELSKLSYLPYLLLGTLLSVHQAPPAWLNCLPDLQLNLLTFPLPNPSKVSGPMSCPLSRITGVE